MTSIPVLVEAKKEYTNQLQQILSPRIYEGFKSIYEELINTLSQDLYEKKTQSTSLIKMFQKSLRDIPLWNNEMIKNEHLRIEKISNCDYLENLIEAVFITNTKILTAVQINNKKSVNVTINVPQSQHFIHKCYIECSKEIYKNPYIFDVSKNVTPKERHNNLRETLNIINNSINNAIRNLLPIRDLLKQGLTNNNLNNDDTEEFDNLSENISIFREEKNNSDNENNKSDDEENEELEEEKNTKKEIILTPSNNEIKIKQTTKNDDGDVDEEKDNKDNDEDDNDEDDNDEDDKDEDDKDEDEDDKDEDDKDEDDKDEDDKDEDDKDNNDDNDDNDKNDDKEDENKQDKKQLSKLSQESYIINKNIQDLIKPEIEEKKIIFLGKSPTTNKISSDSIVKKEEPINRGQINILEKNETKKIELENNPIFKKIDVVTKNNSNSSPSINEVIKPLKNNFVKKISNNKFIKQMPSSNKSSKSFYQKKYDENLANFNFTSENNNDNEEGIQNLQNKEKKIIDLNSHNSDNSDNQESYIDFE